MDYIPLFARRLTTTRLDQELGRRPERVRRIDSEYKVLRAVPLAAGRAAAFPARVDLGRNELALDAGFPAAVQFEDRDDAGSVAARSWARWTDGSAELVIPWPAGGAADLVLRAASGRQRPEAARVRLSLDGQLLGGIVPVPPGMTELRFVVPPGLGAVRNRRLLHIESSTWDPAREGVAGYPDGLGVLVDWVEIRPLPVSAGPSG